MVWWGALFVLCLAVAWPAAGQTPERDTQPWSAALEQHIAGWIDGMANQDAQFREWKGAVAQTRALGANSRQWVVTLSKAGRTVGYMIVAERPPRDQNDQRPSFVLLEYGLGNSVLFSDAFAPMVQEAEPVYDGFASYWKVAYHDHQRYIDAKTGERYPPTARPDPPVISALAASELVGKDQRLTRSAVLAPTEADPFDQIDWLQIPSKPASPDRELEALHLAGPGQRVVVTAALFHDEVWAPFVVGTVHVWSGGVTYLGVWDDGLRFLPYAYVNKVGDILLMD